MHPQDCRIFIAPPMFGPLPGAVARGLSQGQGALAAAGVGAAALGPVPGAGVIVDQSVFGRPVAGLSGFFAQAGARAGALAAQLGAPVGRLVVPVVPLDLAYPALWRAVAARRAVAPFDALAEGLAGQARSWGAVLEEIIAALAPREVVLLPALDPGGPVTVAHVLAALVPEAGLNAEEPPHTPAHLPDTALAMLQRLFRQGVALPPRQVARLVAVHERSPQAVPIAAFAPLQAVALRRSFAAELGALAAKPGVRIGVDSPLGFACAAE